MLPKGLVVDARERRVEEAVNDAAKGTVGSSSRTLGHAVEEAVKDSAYITVEEAVEEAAVLGDAVGDATYTGAATVFIRRERRLCRRRRCGDAACRRKSHWSSC